MDSGADVDEGVLGEGVQPSLLELLPEDRFDGFWGTLEVKALEDSLLNRRGEEHLHVGLGLGFHPTRSW